MKQIESTLNTYAVAPLIDWNFGTNAYPQIKFEKLADSSVAFLRDVFGQIIKGGNTLPEGFINEIVSETAKVLKLKWSPENVSKVSEKNNVGKKAYSAFENGKKGIADKLNMDAPKTPLELKKKLLSLKFQPGLEEKCHKLGEKFANGIYNKKMS